MKHPKLIQILQKLSIAQLTKLNKLVESPYFHQTKGVKDLFNYLRKCHPSYPINKVSNEVIAKKLYPELENGIKKIKNFKTDLMKLVEQFLVLQNLSNQPEQQQFLLTQAYQELQLPQNVEGNINKLRKNLNGSKKQGLTQLYQSLQLLHFQYYHPDYPKTYKNKETLQRLIDSLDSFYIAAKYKYTSEVFERTSKLSENYDLILWQPVQEVASNFGIYHPNSLLFYYHHIQELDRKEEINIEEFENIKLKFFSHLEYLDYEDQLAIFRYLSNYLMKALNKGTPRLEILHLDLIKKGLSNQLINWKNRIPITTFLNIVVLGSKCKSFNWVKDFIKEYKNYLNPNLQDDAIKLSNAFITFHQGKPSQAIEEVRFLHLKTPELELYSFPLQAKCYFELYLIDHSYFDTTISFFNNLQQKFRKKYQFSENRKEGYDNFILFLKKLIRLHNKPKTDIKPIKRLIKEISTSNSVIHKSWLLEKVKQIFNFNY